MKKITSLILGMFLVFPLLAGAQGEALPRSDERDVRQGTRQTDRTTNQDVRQTDRTVKQDTRQTDRDVREGERQVERDDRKQAIDQKKAEARATVAAKKEELQSKIAKIKDEQKQRRVARINDRFVQINEKTVANFASALDKLVEAKNRVSDRAESLAARGIDIAPVTQALGIADGLITTADQAIKDQAGRAYAVADAIGDEKTLRDDIAPLRDQMKKDLTSVKEDIKAAREGIKVAATTLAQLEKANGQESATSSQ